MSDYPQGAKFRVIAEGAYLTGYAPLQGTTCPGALVSWRQNLAVGDVIECRGYGPDWGSDPGYGIHWVHPEASHVMFHPYEGGIFNFHPKPGYLERVDA